MSKLIIDPSFYTNQPQRSVNNPAGGSTTLEPFPRLNTGQPDVDNTSRGTDQNAIKSRTISNHDRKSVKQHVKHNSDDTYGGYSDEIFSFAHPGRGVVSVGGTSANSNSPPSQEWVIPRRIMCSFFWIGIILLFTGIVLMVTSKHQQNG